MGDSSLDRAICRVLTITGRRGEPMPLPTLEQWRSLRIDLEYILGKIEPKPATITPASTGDAHRAPKPHSPEIERIRAEILRRPGPPLSELLVPVQPKARKNNPRVASHEGPAELVRNAMIGATEIRISARHGSLLATSEEVEERLKRRPGITWRWTICAYGPDDRVFHFDHAAHEQP